MFADEADHHGAHASVEPDDRETPTPTPTGTLHFPTRGTDLRATLMSQPLPVGVGVGVEVGVRCHPHVRGGGRQMPNC
jgi:hypothetical protein